MSDFTNAWAVTKETMDALLGLHGCQAVAVRAQAKEIAETLDLSKMRGAFPFSIAGVPITTERALELAATVPAELGNLKQDEVSDGFLGIGADTPTQGRVRLGRLLAPSEAVEIGSHLLELIVTVFTASKPSKGDSKVYHGLWELRAATHHEPSRSLYLGATITEKMRTNGLSTVVHSLELFRSEYRDDFETVLDEGRYPEDVQGAMLELQEASAYEHVANTGAEAELDSQTPEDAARAARLLAYMAEPFLREINRKTELV